MPHALLDRNILSVVQQVRLRLLPPRARAVGPASRPSIRQWAHRGVACACWLMRRYDCWAQRPAKCAGTWLFFTASAGPSLFSFGLERWLSQQVPQSMRPSLSATVVDVDLPERREPNSGKEVRTACWLRPCHARVRQGQPLSLMMLRRVLLLPGTVLSCRGPGAISVPRSQQSESCRGPCQWVAAENFYSKLTCNLKLNFGVVPAL